MSIKPDSNIARPASPKSGRVSRFRSFQVLSPCPPFIEKVLKKIKFESEFLAWTTSIPKEFTLNARS